jgi:RNA polymerase sigma factor (sigma-70 family)
MEINHPDSGASAMAAGELKKVLHYLHTAVGEESAGGLTDGDLLNRFVRHRDEAAFEALVRRHGPLVYGVCRRLLGHAQDAEDAFQATFLVLVRRAATLHSPGSVANWLYGVANRTALELRRSGARRRLKEASVMPRTEPVPDLAADWREPLDEELARLPDKYRAVVVLCELEGKTRREAARELGCAEGTVASRLARGRSLLAERLARRGVCLSAAALAAALAGESARACVPNVLVSATVQAAGRVVAGQAVATAVSTRVAAVTEGVVKAMFLTRLKIATAALLIVTGALAAAGLMYQVRAAEPPAAEASGPRNPDQAKPQEKPADDSLAVTGKVVDERGTPAAGVRVRLIGIPRDSSSTTTDADGKFRLPLSDRRNYERLLVAEDAGGVHQGLGRFEKVEAGRDLRITLRPALSATVRVVDAQGQPVSGAWLAVFEESIRMLSMDSTPADGTAVLRYPAGAKIAQVCAFKSGLGFDYVSTLLGKRGTTERKPLPGEITLKLTGARTVRVKAVDTSGRPVAGIRVYPWYVQQAGKPEDVNLSGNDAFTVTTDASGVAVFDWVPSEFEGPISFLSNSLEYSYVEQTNMKPGTPDTDLTMHLLRKAKISGKVLRPDGRPAAGIVVEAAGAGPAVHNEHAQALTWADGSYDMLVHGEEAYVVTVVDDRWAAPSHVGVLVREGRPVGGLDFQLAEGTIVRGTVTVGTDRRPGKNLWLSLAMRAGEIPEDIRKPGDKTYHEVRHDRGAGTDAQGRFRFCVGPGKYQLVGPALTEPVTITVTTQREIVQDFHMPRPEFGRLTGKVVDQDGKPVAGAALQGVYGEVVSRGDMEGTTAADGTFEVQRVLVPAVLYARTKDRKAAGLARMDAEQEQVTIRVGPVAEARGRLLNGQGAVVAGGSVQYGVYVYEGPPPNSPFRVCFGGVVTAGPDGRYTLEGLVPGEEYHVAFEQGPEGPWSGLTTVKPTGVETIELGDTAFQEPARPLSPEEKTARFFKRRGKLSERIAQARAEARRHYLRVLLVVADPGDEKARRLNELREGNEAVVNALAEYEQVPVAADDADALGVLRQAYGLDGEALKAPVLLVLGDDGKVLATRRPKLEAKDATATGRELVKFLAAQALPRLDAEKLVADALGQAGRERKRVFLVETGTYCPWCRVLARFLDGHKDVLAPHYVFVEIDRGRFAHGDEVMNRYRHGEDRSIPWCAILDDKGKVLANWEGPDGNIGFPSGTGGIDRFLHILADTAPGLTPDQLNGIRRALEEQR